MNPAQSSRFSEAVVHALPTLPAAPRAADVPSGGMGVAAPRDGRTQGDAAIRTVPPPQNPTFSRRAS